MNVVGLGVVRNFLNLYKLGLYLNGLLLIAYGAKIRNPSKSLSMYCALRFLCLIFEYF